MRVRGFTQDDAHIFCREDQIVEETEAFIRLTKMIHADLGMQTAYINLATRPEIRAGSDEFWDKAEGMLAEAAKAAGVFWKNEREFLRQARAWTLEHLLALHPEVLAADLACKTAGAPDQLLAERLALTIAGRARRLGL